MRKSPIAVRKILIIGTDPEMNSVLSAALKYLGYAAEIGGLENIEEQDFSRFSGALIDDDLRAQMKLREAAPDLPKIFLYASTPPNKEGCRLVAKPFDLNNLAAELKEMIGNQ